MRGLHSKEIDRIMSASPAFANAAKATRKFLNTRNAAKTQCGVVAEKTQQVLRQIRKEGMQGVGDLNTFLAKNNVVVEAPHGAVFALNIILHVFVLFLALTLLYIFVISPLESKTLQNEVDEKLVEALQTTVQSTSPKQQKSVGEAMYVAMPVLNRLAETYSQPDTQRQQHNKDVFVRAGLIALFLGILFAIVICILASCKVKLKSHVLHVLLENLVIFAIIGVVEFMFFQFVAKKFVPTMPSQLGSNALKAAQQAFTVTSAAPSSV